MSTIWKYPLPMAEKFTLDMPKGAKIIAMQVQLGTPCIWAIVDPDLREKEREFVMVGTGHELPDCPIEFIGTFQAKGGDLVLHVFEVL